MDRQWAVIIIALCFIALMSACNDSPEIDSLSGPAQPGAGGTRELPTLYPTATPWPLPAPTDTRPPRPTAIPATEVPFDQLVVDVRYTIPALELDRRIRGNVSGELELVDETSGQSVMLRNRTGVILEMQQALPRANIDTLPPECDSCVQVAYELPLTGDEGQGWLDDVQLSASLENYTTVFLGPHFPPGTVAGLHRAATPYHVAHAAAITAGGQVWAWTATEAQIDGPANVEALAEDLDVTLGAIDWESVPETIGQACYEGDGRQLLWATTPDEPRMVEIRCPALYLPGQLLPLYLGLDGVVAPKLPDETPDPPELPMSLETMLAYDRDDGSGLRMTLDGQLTAVDGQGARYTSTLTTTQFVSLTAPILASDLLAPQAASILSEEAVNVIVLRAADAVYELAWVELDSAVEALIAPFDELLEQVIQSEPEPAEEEGEATAEPTATQATAEPTVTPTGTGEP